MPLSLSDTVWCLRGEYTPLASEKAVVKLQPGCLWSYILSDDTIAGIAFVGPSSFAVDAIAETDAGAVGESVQGQLKGIQMLLHQPQAEDMSKEATNDDIGAQGFKHRTDLLEEMRACLSVDGNHGKVNTDREDGIVLLGQDDGDKKIILVARKDDKLVFIHDEKVHVISRDNLVHADKEQVIIRGEKGRSLRIGPNGIEGLGLEHIGKTVFGKRRKPFKYKVELHDDKKRKKKRDLPDDWDKDLDFETD